MRVAIVIALVLGACSAATQKAAEEAYGAELKACVKTSTTKADSDACQDRVRARWGTKDAGGDQ